MPDTSYCAKVATPFALVGVRTAAERLVRIEYLPLTQAEVIPRNALARETCRQIRAYLRDARFRFDLPIKMIGTEFQRRVWDEIAVIPSGVTRTYGELARRVGSVARPVGGACGSNPVPLVVPCHRVIAAAGQLGGFMHSRVGRPIAIKRWLLEHELGS
jgi:methylated-DNA-[protein]-cysteine S-methyltransferase